MESPFKCKSQERKRWVDELRRELGDILCWTKAGLWTDKNKQKIMIRGSCDAMGFKHRIK